MVTANTSSKIITRGDALTPFGILRSAGLKIGSVLINDCHVPGLQRDVRMITLLDHMMSHQGTVPNNMVVTTAIEAPTPAGWFIPV